MTFFHKNITKLRNNEELTRSTKKLVISKNQKCINSPVEFAECQFYSVSLPKFTEIVMILKLIITGVICTAVSVNADILNANDAQTCIDLCSSCHGTASFVDGRCECYIPDGNEQGDCISRAKRQADDLGMDFMDCEAATAERPARCNLRANRIRTNDAARIANYFMHGGPRLASPILQPQCDTDNVVGAPNPQGMTVESESMTDASIPSIPYTDTQLSSTSDGIVGAPLLPSLYNPLHTPSYRHSSLRIPYQPLTLPQLPPPAPWRLNLGHYPFHSSLYYPSSLSYSLPSPGHLPLHYNPPSLHYPLYRQPVRHRLLGASQGEEPTESTDDIVGAPHKSHIPPVQMMRERPYTLAAPRPIVQPGYTHQSVAVSSSPAPCNAVLSLLHQTLLNQNKVLNDIRQQLQLQDSEPSLGVPRVFYQSEAKLGISPPKSSGESVKAQEAILGSPRKDCNKQRTTRMSPAIETLVEGISKIEKIEEMGQLEKSSETGNEQLVAARKVTREETSARAPRESRPNVNGRQRKRELKKFDEKKSD